MRTLGFLAIALLAATALAGCGGPGGGQEPLPPEWRGRDLREPGWVNETLQPGYTVAYEYEWSAGKRVDWDWVVVAPIQQRDPVFTAYVHFQLVRMDGETPKPLAAYDAQEGQGERTIVQSGTHQMDVLNEWTQPVTVAVKFPAGAERIVYPPGQGPSCVYSPGSGMVSPQTASSSACLRLPVPPA